MSSSRCRYGFRKVGSTEPVLSRQSRRKPSSEPAKSAWCSAGCRAHAAYEPLRVVSCSLSTDLDLIGLKSHISCAQLGAGETLLRRPDYLAITTTCRSPYWF
jgi:hypothetical protein